MRGSGPGWSRSTTSDPMGSGKLDALAQLPAGPARIRSLGTQAAHLDALFYHRETRRVRTTALWTTPVTVTRPASARASLPTTT